MSSTTSLSPLIQVMLIGLDSVVGRIVEGTRRRQEPRLAPAPLSIYAHITLCVISTLRPLGKPSASPPWVHWKLDKTFFETLSQWTIDHPETTLDRVLDRIRSAIDNGQGFLDLVPDSPFPARGLVGALAHLIKLGAVSYFTQI